MSAGGGKSTAVFGGIVNLTCEPAAGAGVVIASSEDRNCAGVSGAPGARLLVSLQAQSSPNPAKAKIWSLTGGTKRVPDQRNDRRLRLNTNFVKNLANILVEHAAPRREGRDLIVQAGQSRGYRQTMRDLSC